MLLLHILKMEKSHAGSAGLLDLVQDIGTSLNSTNMLVINIHIFPTAVYWPVAYTPNTTETVAIMKIVSDRLYPDIEGELLMNLSINYLPLYLPDYYFSYQEPLP